MFKILEHCIQSCKHTHYTYAPSESLVHAQKACTNLKAHDKQVKLHKKATPE